MRACDDDDGMPRHQVIRFQPIAPMSAPAQTATPVSPTGISMMSLPIVSATRTPTNPPMRFITAASARAIRGVSARVETEVAMALDGVVEAVRVREAHRQHDDERDGQPVHPVRTPGPRWPRP